MSEIKVIGTGRKKYPVNRITVHINNQIVDVDYQNALKKEKEAFNVLKEKFGSTLKTAQFRVDPQYETKEENGFYKQVFVGYQVNHSLFVNIGLDYEKLGEIIEFISHVKPHPLFHVEYGSDNIDEEELLRLAVQDAKKTVSILADEASLELDSIKSIQIYDQPVYEARMMKMSNDSQMEFDDIEKSKSIEVIWQTR